MLLRALVEDTRQQLCASAVHPCSRELDMETEVKEMD